MRDVENGEKISALEYEAYPEMAEREIRRLLEEISKKNPCLAAKVIHRVGIDSRRRNGDLRRRGRAASRGSHCVARRIHGSPEAGRADLETTRSCGNHSRPADVLPAFRKAGTQRDSAQKILSLDEAISEIQSRCQPLPAVRVRLEESFGRVLRETVFAPEDLPPFDCSTRDGFAILKNDASENFQVVDTIHAADWKPRELKSGEAVRIATGAPLPCENLRVVMQENVERSGDRD